MTLHFYIFYTFLFLYNTRQEPLSGIASKGGGGGGVKGEVASGSAPPVWI